MPIIATSLRLPFRVITQKRFPTAKLFLGRSCWPAVLKIVAHGSGETIGGVKVFGHFLDVAFPLPVMDIFIFLGLYSKMGTLRLSAAAMATPCARPSLSMDCTFLPKKGASMANSSGKWRSARACVSSKMRLSLSGWSANFSSRITPMSRSVMVRPEMRITPKPMMVVPGSMPRMTLSVIVFW
jgi:hypothetical protein